MLRPVKVAALRLWRLWSCACLVPVCYIAPFNSPGSGWVSSRCGECGAGLRSDSRLCHFSSYGHRQGRLHRIYRCKYSTDMRNISSPLLSSPLLSSPLLSSPLPPSVKLLCILVARLGNSFRRLQETVIWRELHWNSVAKIQILSLQTVTVSIFTCLVFSSFFNCCYLAVPSA